MPIFAPPPITSQFRDEYVSSLSYGWYPYQGERELPTWIDDNTAYLNEDLYEQMQYDAQIRANLNLLTYGILGGGLEVTPAANNAKDREVAEFVKRCLLDYLEDTPLLTEVLPDLLSAMAVGNRISEVVWDAPGQGLNTGQDRNRWTINRVKVKDRKKVTFWIDAASNVTGIAIRDINPLDKVPEGAVRRNNLIIFPLAPELFKDNFGWVSWRPKNADPRGTSILQSVYYAWWCKQQAMPEWMKYMANFAIGSIWAELAPNADRGPRNTVALDGTVTESDAPLSAADEMVAKLQLFQNMSVMAVPNGTKINTIQSTSDGRPFPLLLDFLNTEINKGMTGQDTANTSDGGSGRSAIVGQEIINQPITHGCMVAERFVQRHLVNPLIRKNYSRLVRPPKVRFPGANKDDFLTSASGVSKLLLTNVFPPETWDEIFMKVGLPLPSPETMKKVEDNYWKMLASKAMPKNSSRLASDGQNIQERN